MLKSNFLEGILLLFAIFLSGICSCNAYELVLPQKKNTTVTTNYALFIGKAGNEETITINNEHIYVASNGAFAHTVKLKTGENRVMVRSNYNTQIYKIYKKNIITNTSDESSDIERKAVIVKNDNTPLRSTPIDAGLNRISHLFRGTTVLIDGTKGDFYRVYLAKNKTAWIAKKDVEDLCEESSVADFINMDSQKYKNANVQTISFTKNLPYTAEDAGSEILFRVYNPELSDNSVYTLNIPKPEKYYYNVTLQNGQYTFKVSELPHAIEDCTIVIDAGHGGAEKGAIGCLGDAEKDINLRIALELQKQLEKTGANVIMTRECDADVSLNDRIEIAKKNDADIFISIHLNSIGDVPMNVHKIKGTSVYYFNKNSEDLAECLEKSVTKAVGTAKDGVKTASFAVIRPSNYIGVLIETAYMINPNDSVLYTSENFAANVASGITEGIIEYINK